MIANNSVFLAELLVVGRVDGPFQKAGRAVARTPSRYICGTPVIPQAREHPTATTIRVMVPAVVLPSASAATGALRGVSPKLVRPSHPVTPLTSPVLPTLRGLHPVAPGQSNPARVNGKSSPSSSQSAGTAAKCLPDGHESHADTWPQPYPSDQPQRAGAEGWGEVGADWATEQRRSADRVAVHYYRRDGEANQFGLHVWQDVQNATSWWGGARRRRFSPPCSHSMHPKV